MQRHNFKPHDSYYDSLLALLDHAVTERFVRPEHRALILEEREPERLLDRLATYRPATIEKWIDPDER
jgi:predicted Rossmann-fold nucleotide-binding protein